MNQVYVCGTYFHVYVSILRSIYSQDKNLKSLIVINDRTPGIEKILDRLRASGYFDYITQVPFIRILKTIKTEKSSLARWFWRNKTMVQFVEADSEISKYDEFIQGAEINLFSNLGLSPAYFLVKYKNNFFRQIEDGEGNYRSRIGYFQAFKRRYILNSYVGEGLDEPVKEILVQFPEKLYPRQRKKGKKLELIKMVDGLKEHDRQQILDIFMAGLNIKVSDRKRMLLITQPLSEDNHMSEKAKLRMYNLILQHYAPNYELYMKPHPRELTNYNDKLKFPTVIIPGGFPLELFNIMGSIKFDVGITISSSSISNISCVQEKILLGRKYFKEHFPENWHEELKTELKNK